MTSFEEHSDGRIYVRTDAATYIDTVENFTADNGAAPDALPDGVVERVYVPGRRHALGDGDGNTVAGGDRVWAFGDNAIAAIATLIAAQTARNAPQG